MLRQTSSHLQYSSRSDYPTKHKHEGHVGGCLPFDCASIADLALSPAGLSRHQRWPEETRQRLGRQRSLHILLALPTMCHPRFPAARSFCFFSSATLQWVSASVQPSCSASLGSSFPSSFPSFCSSSPSCMRSGGAFASGTYE